MKYLLLLLFVFIIGSCDIRNNHQSGVEDKELGNVFSDSTTAQMIDSVFNIGKITDGENATFSFRFKNTGDKPLVISAAQASCGCTVPEKPEAPIKPGETGFIKVVFHSKGRVGPVEKQVHVLSNARPALPVLRLTGEVLPAK